MTAYPTLRSFDNLADRLRLHRQVDQGLLLVVEGESDKRFCEDMLSDLSPTVFVAGTRKTALETASGVRRHGLRAVVCVVDRDFDDVVAHAEANGDPVAVYDGADLEAMLCLTNALPRLISEMASADKLRASGGTGGVIDRAWEAMAAVGTLRRANADQAWGLNFDGCEIRRHIHLRTLDVKLDAINNALLSISVATNATAADLFALADFDPPRCPVTGLVLVRGRDFLAFIGVALRRVIGSLPLHASKPDHLARLLRSTVRPDDIRPTKWRSKVEVLAA
jgi:Protein of unknown function (DUF4435)